MSDGSPPAGATAFGSWAPDAFVLSSCLSSPLEVTMSLRDDWHPTRIESWGEAMGTHAAMTDALDGLQGAAGLLHDLARQLDSTGAQYLADAVDEVIRKLQFIGDGIDGAVRRARWRAISTKRCLASFRRLAPPAGDAANANGVFRHRCRQAERLVSSRRAAVKRIPSNPP